MVFGPSSPWITVNPKYVIRGWHNMLFYCFFFFFNQHTCHFFFKDFHPFISFLSYFIISMDQCESYICDLWMTKHLRGFCIVIIFKYMFSFINFVSIPALTELWGGVGGAGAYQSCLMGGWWGQEKSPVLLQGHRERQTTICTFVGQFRVPSSPHTHVFGRNPENPEGTYTDTGRMSKLTERPWGSNLRPSCCEGPALFTATKSP